MEQSSAARPLVIVGSFAASLLVGLVLLFLVMGGSRNVAAPAAIGGPSQRTLRPRQHSTPRRSRYGATWRQKVR